MTLSAADLLAIREAQAQANRRRSELAFMVNGSRAHEVRKAPPVDYGLQSEALATGEGGRPVTHFDPYVLDPKTDPEQEAMERSPSRPRRSWPRKKVGDTPVMDTLRTNEPTAQRVTGVSPRPGRTPANAQEAPRRALTKEINAGYAPGLKHYYATVIKQSRVLRLRVSRYSIGRLEIIANKAAELYGHYHGRVDLDKQNNPKVIISIPRAEAQPEPQQPKTIAYIWPLMGINAQRNKKGGAWRVYVAAKTFDGKGSGWVKQSVVLEYLHSRGYSPRSVRRWVAQAISLGVLTPGERKSSGVVYRLAKHEKAAQAFDCEHVESRRAAIELDKLFIHGKQCNCKKQCTCETWTANLFAAHESTYGGRPVSRRTKRNVTGLPESTQRRYDAVADVTRIYTYHKTLIPAGDLEKVKQAETKGIKPRQHATEKGSVVAYQGPNETHTLGVAKAAKRGRSRKVNQALRDRSCKGLPLAAQYQGPRRYSMSPKETRKMFDYLRKQGTPISQQPAYISQRGEAITYLDGRTWVNYEHVLLGGQIAI